MSEFIFGDLTNWVESVIEALGYSGVAFLIALENIFPPIPSEAVLPAAGLFAERNGGLLPLGGMIMAATLGSLAGAWALYGIGAVIGPERLRIFVVRHGRWFGIKEMDLIKAEAWFDRYGEAAVLVCRCIPLARSLVSVPAGIRRMAPLPFTLYTAAGSAVWNTMLIMVGYAASSYLDEVQAVIGYLQYFIIVAVVLAVAWFAWNRIIKVRTRVPPEDTGPQAP